MSRQTTRPSATPAAVTTRPGVIVSTGEVVDIEFPAQRGRRRTGRRKVYALVDLEVLDHLELSAAQWRVLHRVMRAVHPDSNVSAVQVSQIAADLGMHRSNVSRNLHELAERRVVTRLRQGQYRVNAHVMYRGSNHDWDTATEHEPEPLWRRP